MKGINAFSAMSGVDDRFVMASLLPADIQEGAGAFTKLPKQERDNWFTRMTSSGWFAAAISLVVAFGVLAGIVAAGRMAPQNPSHGPGPSSGFPAGTLQNMPESEHDESDESREEGSDIPFETSPVYDHPVEPQTGSVAVMSDGFTVYPKGYCVRAWGQQLEGNGELTGFDADGIGAVNQLVDIYDELPKMVTTGYNYSLTLADNMTLTRTRVFYIGEEWIDHSDASIKCEYVEVAVPTDPALARDVLLYLEEGDYVIVLEIYYNKIYSADEYVVGRDEYAFRLTVEAPVDIPDAPRMTLTSDSTGDSLDFGDQRWYAQGYMGWNEKWNGNALERNYSLGAMEQLGNLVPWGMLDGLRLEHTVNMSLDFTLHDSADSLLHVFVYSWSQDEWYTDGSDLSVLAALPADTYIVILQIQTLGDFITEADTYERTCYEYPFILEVYNP